MAAKIITVVNMKGGVGKTTTVIALAETLAAMDKATVLVVDLDTQASASYSIVGDQILTDLIQDNRTVDAYFDASLIQKQPTAENGRLSLRPIHLTYSNNLSYI